MNVISKFTVPRNLETFKPAAAPVKETVEAKPVAAKKRAAAKIVEPTPEVVSIPVVEEPVIEAEEISDDIKEILANSEV